VLFGFLCVLVLAAAFLVIRGRVDGHGDANAWAGKAERWEKVVAAALLVTSLLPLARLFPWAQGTPKTHFGDALAHVQVARDVARHGLPHGWVDTYLGGFPFGLQYPPLGTLLLAGTLKLGFSPVVAAHLWGALGTIAAPVALYVAALRVGARPAFAAVGASYVACVSPYNPFVGGYEAFFQSGIFAQVLALPICIFFAAAVARGGHAWPAPFAALAMATHPQVAVATLGVVGLASLASGRRAVMVRFARGGVGGLVAGLALYGPGIASTDIPFGWPPDLGWKLIGFGTSRLDWWFLDGDLLDQRRRAPALTALAFAALLALAFRVRRPAVRAGLVATASALVVSVSGPWLLRLEPVGPMMLSVLQPVRVLALFPPLGAALVVLALEETAPLVRQAISNLGRPRLALGASWFLGLLAFAVIATTLPDRADFVKRLASEHSAGAGASCVGGPAGYQRDTVLGWLDSLRGGRLWFEDRDDDRLGICLVRDGATLESSVPIGISQGGPGAHVGIHWLAFHRLEPERSGSDRRAEALGVRHVLRAGPAPTGWEENRRSGDLALFSHARPTDLVGAGCIVEQRRGNDRALRERLVGEFKTSAGTDRLLDPERFVALEHGDGEPSTRAVDLGSCDASGAQVEGTPREPGAFEAVVETRTPVDVVFRAAAFPTWSVSIDGKPARRIELVAPGFFTVRVPAGRHRVVAVVSAVPGYLFGIALGALGVAAASVIRLDHVRRARTWVARIKRPLK
jgi:hypothetical protein